MDLGMDLGMDRSESTRLIYTHRSVMHFNDPLYYKPYHVIYGSIRWHCNGIFFIDEHRNHSKTERHKCISSTFLIFKRNKKRSWCAVQSHVLRSLLFIDYIT